MEQLIDWEVARECIPGGDEGILELAGVLHSECEQLLTEIEAGLTEQDAQRVSRSAHTLKSSAKYFGAQPVVDAAQEIEQLGGEEKFSESLSHLPALQLLTKQLQRELASLAHPSSEN